MSLPRTLAEDHPYFRLEELDKALEHYDREGYMVIRGLIPAELCDEVTGQAKRELYPTRTPVLRQTTMHYELSKMTPEGWMLNPVFNCQDINARAFPHFKEAVLDVVTNPRVQQAAKGIVGGQAKMVQTMYFEAAAGTWPHQDSYYQDSSRVLGGMTAAWYAMEDIDPDAGRFYIVPGSHKHWPVTANVGDKQIGLGHETYKHAMEETLERSGNTAVAPYLAKGDVVLWSSLTVHGSLPQTKPGVSRKSLTAHYMEETDPMLQFHTRIREQRKFKHNDMVVTMLHDQTLLSNQVYAKLSQYFPETMAAVRRNAINLLAKRPTETAPKEFQPGTHLAPAERG
jgi:phytanoyl-CoA hydroxylase